MNIVWKGTDSASINGLRILGLPPISKPQMRALETTIDGRDGSIIEELGYQSYEKTIQVGLVGNYDIDEVLSYFSGKGELVMSNEPDKKYTAQILSQIDYEKLLRFRVADIKFRIQPYKYAVEEETVATETATASGTRLCLNDIGALTSLVVSGTNGTIETVGKNLLDIKKHHYSSNNGMLSVLNEDGSLTTSGIPKANYVTVVYCSVGDLLVTGHTYTISQAFPNDKLYIQIAIQNRETKAYTYLMCGNKLSQTFVADVEKNTYVISVQTSTMTAYGTEDAKITNFYMLEEGSVSTEFEPCETFSYDYTAGEDISSNVEVFAPHTTIVNSNDAEMDITYIKALEVVNKGLETSKPQMTISGSGVVEIKVNGIGMFTYTFPANENLVVIYSEIQEAYLGIVLKNRNMNGEFPILKAGTNKITWTGDVEYIEVEPKSRWL